MTSRNLFLLFRQVVGERCFEMMTTTRNVDCRSVLGGCEVSAVIAGVVAESDDTMETNGKSLPRCSDLIVC